MHSIENLVPTLDEGHLGRVVFSRQRIHPQTILVVRNCLIRFTLIIQESPENQPVGIGGRAENKVAIGVCGLFVVRTKNQIFATLAFVRTRAAGVGHKAKVGIIDRARSKTCRHLNHQRTRPLQVEKRRTINGICIAR